MPMNGPMTQTAAGQPVTPEGVSGSNVYTSGRERAGVLAFVIVAFAATAAWLVLLAWLIILLVRSVF
jgi:hypothetical protein